MTPTVTIAPVRKSMIVKASAEHAFDVFAGGIDRWWPKSHGLGATPIRHSIIEPFVGGRWYTQCEDGTDVVVGHVRTWLPGRQLVVSWEIGAAWKPDARSAMASEVDVQFVGQADGTTRVDLEHRKFERMGDADGATMRAAVDKGWPAILDLYVKAVA